MVVAVDKGGGPGFSAAAQRRPQGFPLVYRRIAQGMRRIVLRIPLDKQAGTSFQGEIIIAEERPVVVKDHRRSEFVQPCLRLDGAEIKRGLILTALDQAREQVIAQIFANEQTIGGVHLENFRGRKTLSTQIMSCADKGLHPPGGQSRHGIVTRSLTLLDRFIQPAGLGFQRRRLIHQHEGGAILAHQPLVATRRGIARQRLALGFGKARTEQETLLDGLTVCHVVSLSVPETALRRKCYLPAF